MNKRILKEFLKAGYIENYHLFPTEKGTPQGGPVRREVMPWIAVQSAFLSIQNVSTLMCISGNGFVQSSEDNEV